MAIYLKTCHLDHFSRPTKLRGNNRKRKLPALNSLRPFFGGETPKNALSNGETEKPAIVAQSKNSKETICFANEEEDVIDLTVSTVCSVII